MPKIILETKIKATQRVVFDLSRKIDFHQLASHKTKEKAIAGRTSGLIELGETVTWKAKHLGFYQKLTSEITEMKLYDHFTDEMIKGIFKSIKHKHEFIPLENGTLMIDTFDYCSPLEMFGKLADFIFLKQYMTNFLLRRNKMIKEQAES